METSRISGGAYITHPFAVRPGARRKIGDGEVDRVVTLTLEGTPHDATHWSTRAMATRSDLRLTRLALG